LGFVLSGLFWVLLEIGWGGTFVVETPPMKTRVEATKQLRLVVAEGFNARLIRRYRHGVGYEYVVSLPGFPTSEEANQNALSISKVLGSSLSVYERDVQSSGERLGLQDPRPPLTPKLAPAWRELALEQMRWVAEQDGFLPALREATQVEFEFLRTGPDGLVERRRYVREQDTEFVVLGPRDHQFGLWLEPDEAWIKTPDGAKRAVNRAYAESQVREQSPSRVLGSGVEQLRELLDRDLAPALHADGLIEVNGKLCYLLSGEVGPSRTRISVAFDTRRFRLMQIVVGSVGQAWSVEFDEYHEEVNGLNIPHAISVWFGGEILYQFDILALSSTFDVKSAPKRSLNGK
jgi:hypothetical protein